MTLPPELANPITEVTGTPVPTAPPDRFLPSPTLRHRRRLAGRPAWCGPVVFRPVRLRFLGGVWSTLAARTRPGTRAFANFRAVRPHAPNADLGTSCGQPVDGSQPPSVHPDRGAGQRPAPVRRLWTALGAQAVDRDAKILRNLSHHPDTSRASPLPLRNHQRLTNGGDENWQAKGRPRCRDRPRAGCCRYWLRSPCHPCRARRPERAMPSPACRRRPPRW